jgi:hypothetical protein
MKAVLAVVGIAGIVALGLVTVGDEAFASNMGFKENKQLFRKQIPSPKGQNLMALPFNNPYNNAQALCSAFSLPAGGPTLRIIDADLGIPYNYFCDPLQPDTAGPSLQTFPSTRSTLGVGVEFFNLPADVSGIVVGSHRPGTPINMYERQGPLQNGVNMYSVPFHTTNANMQDVCIDLGLNVAPFAGNSSVQKIDALSGVSNTFFCLLGGPAGSPTLVLGEAVDVRFTNGLPAEVSISATPSHF